MKARAHAGRRIRKVKCDEGRPACLRCVSTGRVCDGYGIWGGGGNFYGERQSSTIVMKNGEDAPRLDPFGTIPSNSLEEKRYFDWFKSRTAKKIPGAFVLTFWNTLVFQASMSQPAVLHAILTLSAVHKENVYDDSLTKDGDSVNKQEQFMLRHYVKAIRCLQPHFSSKDRASVRVALITCIIFVCLEFLRGHFQSAQSHLQNGLKVLREWQGSCHKDGILLMKPSWNSVDDWLVEAFSRLQFQGELFKQTYRHSFLVLQVVELEPIGFTFHSVNQAWRHIERLLNETFRLTEEARQLVSDEATIEQPSALLWRQYHIQEELARWIDAYEASKDRLQCQIPDDRVLPLLHEYHTMTTIMVAVCLSPDESIYDSCTDQFVFLISQSAKMWEMRSSMLAPRPQKRFRNHMDMPRSLVDVGWIPPLYYTALKCRSHRVRLHAIRLIESTSHREGMWDSIIAACVARKVMEIEERGCYTNVELNEGFALGNSPSVEDLSLPALPQENRLCEVKVALPEGPTEDIVLSYRHTQDGYWREIALPI